MNTILAMRMDDTARGMMKYGVRLMWAQVELLDAKHLDWLRERLGLEHTHDDYDGTVWAPREEE